MAEMKALDLSFQGKIPHVNRTYSCWDMGIFMFWGDLRRVTWFELKWAISELAKSKHLKAVFPTDWCHQLLRNIQVNEGLGVCHMQVSGIKCVWALRSTSKDPNAFHAWYFTFESWKMGGQQLSQLPFIKCAWVLWSTSKVSDTFKVMYTHTHNPLLSSNAFQSFEVLRKYQTHSKSLTHTHNPLLSLNAFGSFEVLWRSQTHSKSCTHTHTIHCFPQIHFSPSKYCESIKCIQSPSHTQFIAFFGCVSVLQSTLKVSNAFEVPYTHTIHCFLQIHFSPLKYFKDIKCIQSTSEGWNAFEVTYTHSEKYTPWKTFIRFQY